MRDRDELEVERTDLAALAVGDRDQLRLAEQSRLLDAAAGETERERRSVDRERHVTQQEREASDMILVPVGRDAAVDAIARSRGGR